MMLIETRVRPSRIHGMGLFTVNAVPRGTPIWKFQTDFDQEFSSEQFALLPSSAHKHLRWFAFRKLTDNGWILSGDHACFMNHSPEPNTGALPEASAPVVTVALCDLTAGEELTCDYYAFDGAAREKLEFDGSTAAG